MGKWGTQSDRPDAVVKVASPGHIHRDANTPVASEFIVQQKGPGGEKVHLGFDEAGNQLFESRK